MEIKIDNKELTINPEKIIGIAIGCVNLLKRYSIYKIMATGGEIAATVLPNKTQKILVKTGSKLLGLGMAFEMVPINYDKLCECKSDDIKEETEEEDANG